MKLGIDFGTTRTVVAAAIDGRYPVAAFDCNGEFVEHLPGVAVASGGTLSFGPEARQQLRSGTRSVARSIKRVIQGLGRNDPVPGFEAEHLSSLELITHYLRYLATMLREHSNLEIEPGEPLEAMVAVPANASTRQRYVTMEAFTRAGFSVLGMVNEPSAAAIEYAYRHLGVLNRRTPKKYLVVYDLGGGTFDTAAVSLAGRRFELLASSGLSRLGGDDFDELILRQALTAASVQESSLEHGTRERLLDVCREAKEGLTPSSKRLLVDLGSHLPGSEPVVLDVASVYEACEPLVDQTLVKIDEIFRKLSDFGIDPEDPRQLGAVYLVGGGVAFPSVARQLRRVYQRKIQLATLPHAATAIGLAVAADPNAEIFVRESATRHFGVWREADHGREASFDPIIVKGARVVDEALLVRRTYRPIHAVGHLRFLECTDIGPHGEPAGDITPWSTIRFPYDPSLAERGALDDVEPTRRLEWASEEIVESYEYTKDGGIHVQIENRTRGYQRQYTLGELG